MGRPWWYDSYWQKSERPKRRFRLPRRQTWVWIALIVLSLLLAMNGTGFRVAGVVWFLGFVNYLCRILTFAVLARAVLSWFAINRYHPVIALLDDITEPILSPLRRVVPALGMFDITPIVAIIVLNFIPYIVSTLVRFFLGF